MRRLAVIALALLAGCGGGEKQPLTAAQWAARADAACGRAADAIAKRGWAHDLNELYRRVPGAVREARGAIDEIRALRLPRGDTDARLFVADLKALEPMLDDLGAASQARDMHDMAVATTTLDHKLRAVQASAQRAELRRCLKRADPWAVVDGLRAPVAAEQLARLELELLDDLPPGRLGEALKTLRRMKAAVSDHVTALGDIKPPYWAEDSLSPKPTGGRRRQRSTAR